MVVKTSLSWESRRNCWFLRRAQNLPKLTHSGNHEQGSSWRGASYILEVSEVTRNRANVRQAPRSQPAKALSPLWLLSKHGATKWWSRLSALVDTQGSAPYNLTGVQRQGVKVALPSTQTQEGWQTEKTKKYGLNEGIEQNPRQRTKWYGDSQPIRCRVQNTDY